MSKTLSAEFDAFVVANKAHCGIKCGICSLPPDLRQVVNDGLKRNVTYPIIAAFLKSKGHALADHVVGNHARRHVER